MPEKQLVKKQPQGSNAELTQPLGVAVYTDIQTQIGSQYLEIQSNVRGYSDNTDDNDSNEEDQPKQRCGGGGCPPEEKKSQEEGLLTVAEKTKSVHLVALEKAENDVSEWQEFLEGITIHFARYEKKSNNRWENKKRDLVELFNSDKPGGNRVDRYKTLKNDMHGAKIGIVFSEPTVYEDFNYLQIFINKGEMVEMYAIEHRGDGEDLKKVYTSLRGESRDQVDQDNVSFSTPLFFNEELTIAHIADVIESNFASEESKGRSRDYLSRLQRDVANISLVEDYQHEAEELAKHIEQQLLEASESNGLAMAIRGMITMSENNVRSEITRGEISDSAAIDINERHTVEGENNRTIEQTFDDMVQKDLMKRLQGDNIEDQNIQKALTKEPMIFNNQNIDYVLLWKQTAQDVLNITQKQSEQLLKGIINKFEYVQEAIKILAFVVRENTATGAGIFVLNELISSEEQASEKSIIAELVTSKEILLETGSLKFVMQLTEKEKEFIFAFFIRTSVENQSIDIKKLLPDGVDVDVLVRTIDFIRRIDTLPFSEKEMVIVKEKEKTLIEMSFLWEHLTQMLIHKNTKEKDGVVSITIHFPREIIPTTGLIETRDKKEKEEIENFSIALMVWMLLKLSGYYANLEFVHTVAAKHDKNPIMQLIYKEKPEALIQKEPAPWLLLSIIWYLAMIREQGQAQSQAQTSFQAQQYFPQQGIIFVSCS